MFKKIVAGTLLAGLIGILVLGGINRTVDMRAKVAEARGQGSGQGRAEGESNERGGYGPGGAGNGASERQYPNYQAAPKEWATYEGAVVQTPDDGEELVIATANGQEVTIGTGPSYMAAQGFTLQAGEMVQVQGYWEDDELKAAQVTRLADGQTIALRDEMGRPAWAGGGRNAQARQGGQGAPGDSAGAGQAEVGEWLQFQGIVMSADPDALVVKPAAGEEFIVEGRPWWFAQEQGFLAQVGDQVTLTGFYEGDPLSGFAKHPFGTGQRFEVGRIENISNGQTVLIRDENGRPLWAGFGRRGM